MKHLFSSENIKVLFCKKKKKNHCPLQFLWQRNTEKYDSLIAIRNKKSLKTEYIYIYSHDYKQEKGEQETDKGKEVIVTTLWEIPLMLFP